MPGFDNHLPSVRAHYEALPYPACNPPDDAALIADFVPAFEVLDALDRLLLRYPAADSTTG